MRGKYGHESMLETVVKTELLTTFPLKKCTKKIRPAFTKRILYFTELRANS